MEWVQKVFMSNAMITLRQASRYVTNGLVRQLIVKSRGPIAVTTKKRLRRHRGRIGPDFDWIVSFDVFGLVVPVSFNGVVKFIARGARKVEVPSNSKGEPYCLGKPGDWSLHALAIWLGRITGGWLRYHAAPIRLPVPQYVYAPRQENVATCLTATRAGGPFSMEQDRHTVSLPVTSKDHVPLTGVPN